MTGRACDGMKAGGAHWVCERCGADLGDGSRPSLAVPCMGGRGPRRPPLSSSIASLSESWHAVRRSPSGAVVAERAPSMARAIDDAREAAHDIRAELREALEALAYYDERTARDAVARALFLLSGEVSDL